MVVRVNTTDMKRVRQNIDRFGADYAGRVVAPTMHRWGRKVLQDMQPTIPVKTGLLKRTLSVIIQVRSRFHVSLVFFSNPAFYYKYVEFGTSRIMPRLFTTNAIRKNRFRLFGMLGAATRAYYRSIRR